MIRFACPTCEKVYKVPDTAGGKPATCKDCGTAFLIPEPAVKPKPPEAPRLPSRPVAPPPPVEPEVLEAEMVEAAPPPPPPPKLITPVPLEPCPKCGAVLTLTPDHLGHQIACPFCKTVYPAVERKVVESIPPAALPPPPPAETAKPANERSNSEIELVDLMNVPVPPPTFNFVAFTAPAASEAPPAYTPTAVPPPPPPPEPPGVDIAPCPKCRAELTVAPEAIGGPVECPFCKTVYTAEPPKPKEGTTLAKVVRRNPSPPPLPPEDAKKPYQFKRRPDDDDDDDDDRPRRRRR